jgi:hypothetical protein
MCLNASILAASGWAPFLKLAAEARIPLLITETHEYATEMTRLQLKKAGANVTAGYMNPFRAPCRLFAPENHFSSFSNGYYFGVGV